MRRKKNLFATAQQLEALIDSYFAYIEGESHVQRKKTKGTDGKIKTTRQKTWVREPEPPTIAGLSLFLGFNSKQAFEDYELNGKFADQLKRAGLRIEALYEKKLHTQYTSGAIFALKSLGWNERADIKPANEAISTLLKLVIIHTGPQLASSEKEVVL
jgi:DNA-packaging protein gp3